MTTEESTPPEAPALTDEQLAMELHGPGNDWFLQDLVDLANAGSLEIGVTLNVHGEVVTGFIISRKKYFNTFAEGFVGALNGLDDEEKAQAKAKYVSFGEPPTADVLPGFIHLRDARRVPIHGDVAALGKGVLWRGKINAVSGWTLGVVGVPS